MSDPRTRELVALGDLDALVEHVGALCLDERWDDVVSLHDECRAALERGRQLWPAAAYAHYRLALDAPPRWACAVLGATSERFALGPYTEVIAARCTWDDVRGCLTGVDAPNVAALAQERVLRGDDLRADDLARRTIDVFELPLVRAAWEPAPLPAEYHPDRARFSSPPPAPAPAFRVDVSLPGAPLDDPDALDALAALVAAWRRAGAADVRTVAVEGDGPAAIAALAPSIAERLVAPLDAHAGIGRLGWAAANSGAVGRRRGGAAARADVWWALRALAGLTGDDLCPEVLDELDEVVSSLRWWTWEAEVPAHGWAVAVAVDDPEEGCAWALQCVDRASV